MKSAFKKLQPKDWHYLIAKNRNFAFLRSFTTFQLDLKLENNSSFLEAI